MKIVTYRELEPKNDFMMLMDLAFWWPLSPKTMEERIRTDARLKDGPVGFCAVEDDRLVGHAGVMDIPTRTAEGKEEIVGGIWAVATNPNRARQGISKILMEKATTIFAPRTTASPSSAPVAPLSPMPSTGNWDMRKFRPLIGSTAFSRFWTRPNPAGEILAPPLIPRRSTDYTSSSWRERPAL